VRARVVVVALLLSSTQVAYAGPAKRAVPRYDDRAPPPPTGGDVARGVARVVLFPVRIVVDYGVRWPIGKAITALEHSHGVRSVVRFLFLLPPTPTPSIFPVAFYDFGFQSSIGVRVVWTRGFLTRGSKLSIKLGSGGTDWWRADAGISVAGPRGMRVGIDGGVRRRPDQQFFGLGPRSPQSAGATYLQARFGAMAFVGWPQLSVIAGSIATSTGTSHFNAGLSIEDQVAAGAIAMLPPGYRDLVVTQRLGVKLALDSRGPRGHPDRRRDSSGARLDFVAEKVRDREVGSWLRIDAIVGGALRLDAIGEHKLGLRMHVELIEPINDTRTTDIPFLELATIGGSRDLRGFASGRGRDLSAAALTLDYEWPLAAWLDATLYLGAGNVFERNLAGLTAGKLRGSAGMGLAIAGLSAERKLELWAAIGTEPFDQGLIANSFRLVLGYSHDY
jgi:hypothetical protein